MSRHTRAAEWSADEIDVLARATVQAPSLHDLQPWRLEVDGGQAGRDQAISCGAALLNLELAMRVLGRRIATALLPDPARPEVVAVVTVRGHRSPVAADLHLYSAIPRRRSHRRPFTRVPVSDYDLAGLLTAATRNGVRAHAHRHDSGYPRELDSSVPQSSPRWAELVRTITRAPERADETVLTFITEGDTRLDHVRTGRAIERAWLTAVDAGLVASLLRLAEIGPAVRAKLELGGHPQAAMRVGHGAVEANCP